MTVEGMYRKSLERELEAASWRQGVAAGAHRRQFEQDYLEEQLMTLCEDWHAGAIHPWSFRSKALILNSMLAELERDSV